MKVVKLKIYKNYDKALIKFILILFLLCLIIYSENCINTVLNSTQLFMQKVFPSLFPFLVITNLLVQTDIIDIINKILNPIMKPIFNVSGKGAFALILGLISGYPTGAKIISDFRKNNICSKEDCERLLAYTNNSGPLFILGTVGTSLFLSKEIGFLLLITHVLGALSVGFIFRFYKNNTTRGYENVQELTITNLSVTLSESISSSFQTLIIIFGNVIIFSLIINIFITSGILKIFDAFPNSVWIKAIFLSSFEITNGINIISSIVSKSLLPNIVLTSFFLGFGGLSVLMQVYGIISKTDISIKTYIIGKFLHGIISAIYTLIILLAIPYFNFII